MKKILIFAFMFLFVTSVVFSAQTADPGKKDTSSILQAHQEKMKSCNAEVKTKALKGDERKKFLRECLKEKPDMESASPALQAHREKMKSCIEEARTKALKGDERKNFMSDCLKTK